MRFNRSRREALDQFSASLLERFGGDGITSGGGAPLDVPLGDILVAEEFITEEQRDAALAAQVGTGRRLGEVLVQMQRAHAVATSRSCWPRSSDCPTVDLARYELDDEIVGRLPAPIAHELRAIPLAVEGERVHVACADPLMEALETRLIEALEAPVALVVAAEDEIQWALDHVYATNEQIDGALHDFEARAEARRKELAESAEAVVIEVDENAPDRQGPQRDPRAGRARPGVRRPHRTPGRRVRIRVRTDGALHELMTLPSGMAGPLVSPRQGARRHEHRRTTPSAGRPDAGQRRRP